MRIFAYALRPYDELPCLEALSCELGFDYGWTADYPTLDNAGLAAGAHAVLPGRRERQLERARARLFERRAERTQQDRRVGEGDLARARGGAAGHGRCSCRGHRRWWHCQ